MAIQQLGEHLVSNPEILGGAPIIRGTRLTAYSLSARVEAGECIDDVLEEYPYINYAQLQEALLYAKRHPRESRTS